MKTKAIWALILLIAASAQASPKQNFLFFLVDDLGWADVGCFGSTFHETPHIDALAASGMKFTQGYAAGSVCSPTRASIMTGRHPVRVDITDWIPGMSSDRARGSRFKQVQDRDDLALEEVTLAEALKEHGYQTFFAGKWHLGGKGHWPTDQGFDVNIGGCEKGSPPGGYYAPWSNPNLTARTKDEYVTERLTEESIAFLEKRDPEKPFLLYLSYYNVHTPITPYRKRIGHYQEKADRLFPQPVPPTPEHDAASRARQDNPAYASMVAAVDDSVGALLAALDKQGLAETTAVFFFSDNGGLCTTPGQGGPTSNLPLRSGKGWLYEGGIRETTIIRAPGITQPGSVCASPVVSMDFFPTMLELAGLPPRPEQHIDGRSLLPLLQGAEQAERTFYWHYPHYHGSGWTPGSAVREGNWKLIEFYHFDKVELYDLDKDPGETTDLSEKEPEKTRDLQKKLHRWQEIMHAKMPELR